MNYFNWNIKKEKETVEMEIYPKHEEGEIAIDNSLIKGLTSIIIPAHIKSYPIFHMTGNCIGSIREHIDKEVTPYEIILVLNGDPVHKFNDYKDTYCDKAIPLEKNEGYSVAVNKGIRASRGEYVAVINNDVQVFKDWLDLMQRCLNVENGLDLVMATPMYGRPWARAVESARLASEWEGKPIAESFSDFRDFSCILTKRDLFDEIGLFDEQFFAYGEDLDLMRRMDKANKRYASTKLVNTTHIIGATGIEMSNIGEIMNKSKELLKEKWGE